MPTHVFTLAAIGHAVDAQSNNITLFSVLEQVGGRAYLFNYRGLL